MDIRIETKLANKTIANKPNLHLSPNSIRMEFAAGAEKYYHSKQGLWLHHMKDTQFIDSTNLINSLIRYKPKNEDNCLSYLALALGFGNKSVKNMQNNFRWDGAAHDYYTSNEGSWLHKAKDIQFKDPQSFINWLIGHKPKNEDNSLSYLAQALSFGNNKVRENLTNLQFNAGACDYYTGDKGSWLKKAERIDFDNPFDLIDWLIRHKPQNENNSISTYILALSFGNKKVRENLRNWETYASSYAYYTGNKGSWLRRAERIDFNNSNDLIIWLNRHKPKNEDYALGTFIQALSFGNKKVRENLRNWETNAGAYDYFNGKKGLWLKKAENIDFNNSIDLISWLIKNKPKNEDNSLSYLVQALSFGNKSVQDKLQVFQRSSGAYTYIIKKHAARKNLNQIYSRLISNGINKKAITTRILKKSCNISLFTYLRNEKNEISRKYLYLTFKVYLAFAEHFLTVK